MLLLKMSENGYKENNSNNKLIMMKIQNEIKDIVITKYLSIIMIQDKEISILKTQCEDFLQLSTKILKKTILDETSLLNNLNNVNKNKIDGTSKKSTLNSSNDNLNYNNIKSTNINIINNHIQNANINNVYNKNINENKKLEKKIFNKDLSKSKLPKNLVIPLQRSESLSFLIDKNNNNSNLNDYMFSSQTESARKISKKKIIYSNKENIKEKNNIKQNKILTKSFSKKNINKTSISTLNTQFLTEPSENISRNSVNNYDSLNIKKNISNSTSNVFENKHSKIIQKRIQYNKSLTTTSFISHVNNVNKGKEKLIVNKSKSILNNSNSKQNSLLNINNNYRKEKKLTIISEKDNENKSDKFENFP